MNGKRGAVWDDCVVALATRHGKERQIAPALLKVGLVTQVVPVDTDQFGTFTGEIARQGSARDVVIAKARAGLEAAGFARGVASEGTLGPYPELPALTYDLELVGFVDIERGLTVIEEAMSFETIVASVRARTGDDLKQFLNRVGFPDQGLIVQRADGDLDQIVKGVVTAVQLESAIAQMANSSADGQALVVTDQRAHLCPTRRRVIQEAAERLALRLSRRCPKCSCPGFGLIAHEPGLPCRDCGTPTDLDQAIVEGCSSCGERIRTPSVGTADPTECEYCNP
ncbi:DUF6671 family protein [Ferrimicrobium sp.]|nr:DUF6671 family protein [Ferrimicrobium sp.]